MIAELQRLTTERLEEGATVLDFFIDWTESGNTLTQLVSAMNEELSLKPPAEISSGMVSRYLRTLAPDAEQRISDARRIGAYRLVDQSIDIADAANDKDSAAAARVQVGSRQWTAERWNRDELGQAKQGTQVNINLGSLHLGALRLKEESEGSAMLEGRARVSLSAESSAPAIDSAMTQDAEVLSIESATS